MQTQEISAATAYRRGLLGRCPKCGDGKLFNGYLAVVDQCSACSEPLGIYRSADGPAFFTMTIVGLLLIPIMGISFAVWRPEPVTLLISTGVVITLLSLAILRLVKGAFLGVLWFRKEVDRGA